MLKQLQNRSLENALQLCHRSRCQTLLARAESLSYGSLSHSKTVKPKSVLKVTALNSIRMRLEQTSQEHRTTHIGYRDGAAHLVFVRATSKHPPKKGVKLKKWRYASWINTREITTSNNNWNHSSCDGAAPPRLGSDANASFVAHTCLRRTR